MDRFISGVAMMVALLSTTAAIAQPQSGNTAPPGAVQSASLGGNASRVSWSQGESAVEPCTGREAFPSDFVFEGVHPTGYLNGTYSIACVNRVGIAGPFRSDGVKPYAQQQADGSYLVYMPAATYTFGSDGIGTVHPAAGGSYPLNMKRR